MKLLWHVYLRLLLNDMSAVLLVLVSLLFWWCVDFFFLWYGHQRDLTSFPTRPYAFVSFKEERNQKKKTKQEGAKEKKSKKKEKEKNKKNRKNTRRTPSHLAIPNATFALKKKTLLCKKTKKHKNKHTTLIHKIDLFSADLI